LAAQAHRHRGARRPHADPGELEKGGRRQGQVYGGEGQQRSLNDQVGQPEFKTWKRIGGRMRADAMQSGESWVRRREKGGYMGR